MAARDTNTLVTANQSATLSHAYTHTFAATEGELDFLLLINISSVAILKSSVIVAATKSRWKFLFLFSSTTARFAIVFETVIRAGSNHFENLH